jgi:hypothetical protein
MAAHGTLRALPGCRDLANFAKMQSLLPGEQIRHRLPTFCNRLQIQSGAVVIFWYTNVVHSLSMKSIIY